MPEPDRDPIRWLDAELGEASMPYALVDDDEATHPHLLYQEYVADSGYAELDHQYRQAVDRGVIDPLPPNVSLPDAVNYVIGQHSPDHEIAAWQELRAALEAHGPGATLGDLAAAGKLPKRSGPRPFSIDGYRAAVGGAA